MTQCTCPDAICVQHVREDILKKRIDYHKQEIIRCVNENKIGSVKFHLGEWEKISDLYYGLNYILED